MDLQDQPWNFGAEGIDYWAMREEIEKRCLERALVLTTNRTQAAKLLKMKRVTFVLKLKRHDLD